MKLFMAFLIGPVFIAAASLCGCAGGGKRLVITQPVGPVEVAPAPLSSAGELLVYSGWDRFDTWDVGHPKHTAYTIRSEDGTVQRRVNNQAGSFNGQPETVHLAPGSYRIVAEATNMGSVEVPVVIRERETTVVYLDGVNGPRGQRLTSTTNWVREPDGSIIGWRETSNTP